MKWKRWTKKEEQKLIEIYANEKNDIIAKILNKDRDQIVRKAYALKLKKSKEQIHKNITNRNKIVGRDLNYEKLKEIALKYKTRGEFQRLDPSAYTTARIAGYLDDICSHMITSSYSIPQLILFCIIKKIFYNDIVTYNDKSVIKPYELDIYIKKYKIGFEYDGKLWHINNELDIIKTELCELKNITLIRLKENNRKYEQDIKEQLISNLTLINKACNKNITKSNIEQICSDYINNFVSNKITNEQEIKDIISKYNNFHDFKVNETPLYNKLLKIKILDKYTSHLQRNRIIWTLELINKEILKYDNLSDFINNSMSCYQHIKKNNLSYLLCKLKSKKSNYKIDEIEVIIKEYKYLKEFREKLPNMYSYIKKNNLSYLLNNLKRSAGKQKIFSISNIENEITKYEYLIDFRNNSKKYYQFIKKHNLYYLIKDLKRKPQFFIDDIYNEIKKYSLLKDFREKSPKYYKYIITHKLNYLMKELKKS